jgi:ribose transport system permease protein/putative xylitol transport system permease protein
MLAARLGAAGPGLGESLMLQSITAVAIGGTALTGGVGGIKRTLLGVLVITLLSNGLILTQVSAFAQQIITGLVLILAVTLSLDRRRIAIFK